MELVRHVCVRLAPFIIWPVVRDLEQNQASGGDGPPPADVTLNHLNYILSPNQCLKNVLKTHIWIFIIKDIDIFQECRKIMAVLTLWEPYICSIATFIGYYVNYIKS